MNNSVSQKIAPPSPIEIRNIINSLNLRKACYALVIVLQDNSTGRMRGGATGGTAPKLNSAPPKKFLMLFVDDLRCENTKGKKNSI